MVVALFDSVPEHARLGLAGHGQAWQGKAWDRWSGWSYQRFDSADGHARMTTKHTLTHGDSYESIHHHPCW